MASSSYNYIIPSGVVVPDITQVQADVTAEYVAVFGASIITNPYTPQGMLMQAEILSRQAVIANNAQLANQINPNLAGGVYLDAIGALTGSIRNAEQFSVVSANLTGVAGTVIPAGSLASETVDNQVFQSLNDVTLNISGMATVNFRAVVGGPIVVSINTLTQIITNVIGWETITNPAAAVLGAQQQSDASFRQLRRQTLATQGSSILLAMISAVLELDGVASLFAQENISNTTQVINGVTMISHSVYFCVDGGSQIDVATALQSKKSAGADYNNGPGINISQAITVPISNQVITVLFDQPNLINILVQVTIRAADSLTNPTQSVIDSILAYVNGTIPGENGLIVGQAVSSFELAGAINIQNPGIYVQNLETTLASFIDYSCVEIPIGVFEKAIIAPSSISVTVL